MAKTTSRSTKSTKKRKVIVESTGAAHVTASFNNIIISVSNRAGDVSSWSSAGKMGFRGSNRITPYAAQLSAEDAGKVAYEMGLRKINVFVKGPGSGREAAVRALATAGLVVDTIRDTTPIPHNGCRPPKRRRV